MSVITKIRGWLSKPKPVQPKPVQPRPVMVSQPPAAPAKPRFDDHFPVDAASLKALFGQLKGTGFSLSRKYVFDAKRKSLAIAGQQISQHQEIAVRVWGKAFDEDNITGGKIDINHDGSKFIIILREHSTRYDTDKPDFFERLKGLRKMAKQQFGQIAREIDPGAQVTDMFCSATREIFSISITF